MIDNIKELRMVWMKKEIITFIKEIISRLSKGNVYIDVE